MDNEKIENVLEKTDSNEETTSEKQVEENSNIKEEESNESENKELPKTKELELEASNRQLFERTKKAENEAKVLKIQIESLKKTSIKSLDVDDYIDISASLEGLDQKEKEKLAREHKLTGQPLSEIRNSEDFQLWQSAYQAKIAKEKSLKPSSTQVDGERQQSLAERLAGASLSEKEKILSEVGLWKSPRPRQDRSVIGRFDK